MLKPNNFDNTVAYGDYEPLPAGNYRCMIYQVFEAKSKAGRDMLVVWLDILDGEHRGRFTKEFREDTRQDKDWPISGRYYQLVYDKEGQCNRGFRTLIDAVAASNKGFDPNRIWGPSFVDHFKNMVVGAGFGREQYKNKDGELKWSTKVTGIFPVDEIETRKVPADKPYEEYTPSYASGRTSYEEYSDGPMPWDE